MDGNCCVVYHHPCVDGIFAALVAREKLRQLGCRMRCVPLTSVTTQRVENLALRPSDAVYLLDIAWPRAFVLDVAANCRQLVIVDHHLTAWEALQSAPLPPNVTLCFDLQKSAASLALEIFAPLHFPERLRRIIQYVEDSDLWRMAFAETEWFRAGIGALGLNFDARQNPGIFDRLLGLNLDALLLHGRRIQAQQSIEIDAALRRAFRVKLGGAEHSWGECLAVEKRQYARLRSAIGHRLATTSLEQSLRGIGVVAYEDKHLPLGQIKLSFRAVKAEDTAAIAAHFGGGGHKRASSCNLPRVAFRAWRT